MKTMTFKLKAAAVIAAAVMAAGNAAADGGARLYDAVVAQDGTGDYASVQAAVDAAPENAATPWLIFIKEGTYREHVDVPANKSRLHFIGQGRDKVRISDDKLCGGENALRTDVGATFVTRSSDLYFEGISFVNSYGVEKKTGPQALALNTNGDRMVFNKCGMYSYQDTWKTPKKDTCRAYVRQCFIEGAVDFIYNRGEYFFDGCTLNIVRDAGGYIVAPSHYEATRWGYVFRNTVITAPDEDNTQVYFGRPWHNAPKTVFIDTECRVKTYEGYWYPEMGAIPALWAVYNIWDKNGYLMTNESREDYWYEGDNGEIINGKAKNYLTDEEAAEYTVENVLSGDGSDLATGIWNPLPMVEQTSKPVLREGTDGQVVWDADEYAICYVVKVNGMVKAFVTEPYYAANEGETIVVQSVNEYGALSEPSDEFVSQGTSVDEGIREDADAVITVIGSKGIVSVRGISEPVHIAVYTMNGMLVQEMDVDRNVAFSLPAGFYIVKANGTVAKVSVSR